MKASKQRSPKPGMRKGFRIMFIILGIFFAGIIILTSVLFLVSPGKPEPFLDEDGKPLAGSLSEKIFVTINGVEQGMFIESKDVSNPVLLYIHGGMPEYFLTQKYPSGLEEHFTVVYWEQRGSGLSYNVNIQPETMHVEQFISDTIAVTNYLRNRFGKEKIYLMGHSGGTFIGIQAAARAPELFYAYMGMAQMTNQFESERLAYEYMLREYKSNGNTKMVEKLEAAPISKSGSIPKEYYVLRDGAMHDLGIGTMHDMKSVITGIFFPSFLCRGYTMSEKVNMWRGKASTGVSSMWSEMTATDLTEQVTRVDIPVYFFSGIYDYNVSYSLSKAYFQKLQAPVKGFYTFEQSAHSPIFEEPDKMVEIIREDVLKGTNTLAD